MEAVLRTSALARYVWRVVWCGMAFKADFPPDLRPPTRQTLAFFQPEKRAGKNAFVTNEIFEIPYTYAFIIHSLYIRDSLHIRDSLYIHSTDLIFYIVRLAYATTSS